MTATQFKALRKRLFGSQYKAAEALGITRAAISHYETGRRPIPKIVEKLIALLQK